MFTDSHALPNLPEERRLRPEITVPEGFEVTDSLPNSLGPNQSNTVVISTVTDTPGVYSGLVRIFTDSPNETSYYFSVRSEIGLPKAQITFDGVPVTDDSNASASLGTDFGVIPYRGNQVASEFTFTNAGDVPITFNDLTVSDPNFKIISKPTFSSLGAGSSVKFKIEAITDRVGTFNGTVNLDTDDPAGLYSFGVTSRVAPTLTLSVPSLIDENGGSTAATGIARRNSDQLGSALTVTLASNNSGITVPQTVTIAANETTATFEISAVDNTSASLNSQVEITATAAGHFSATATTNLIDDDAGIAGQVADASSNGVAGVAVYIDADNDGVKDTGETSVVTAADGTYHIGQLSTGTHVLRVVAPDGFVVTDAQGRSVNFTAGTLVADIDLGVTRDKPTLTVEVTSGAEGDELVATFTLDRPVGAGNSATVEYSIEGISASAGDDVDASSGTLTFSGDEVEKSVTIKTHYDNQVEGTEEFRVATTVSGLYLETAETVVSLTDVTELVRLTPVVADLDGNPISTIERGQQYLVIYVATDLRNPEAARGVLSVGLDATYDSSRTSVSQITFSMDDFSQGTIGNDGVINEIIAFNASPDAIVGPVPVFTLTAKAEADGVATFGANIPEGIFAETVLVGLNGDVRDFVVFETVEIEHLGRLTIDIAQASVKEHEGGGAFDIIATRSASDTSQELVVTLQSFDTSEITVPAIVTIPAGETSATVTGTAVDDNLLDGSQTVVIGASADGFVSGTDSVIVEDFETFIVTFDSPTVSENSGTTTAYVARTNTDDPSQPVVVTIVSSDSTEAVPAEATVTIPAGQVSTAFTINVLNDMVRDGNQETLFTASASGYENGAGTLTVTEYLQPDLQLLSLDMVDYVHDGRAMVSGTIRNDGLGYVTEIPLQFILSDDNTRGNADDTVVRNVTITIDNELRTGESVSFEIVVDLPRDVLYNQVLDELETGQPLGTASTAIETLYVALDPGNTADDSNTANNVSSDDFHANPFDLDGDGRVGLVDIGMVYSNLGTENSEFNPSGTGVISPAVYTSTISRFGLVQNPDVLESYDPGTIDIPIAKIVSEVAFTMVRTSARPAAPSAIATPDSAFPSFSAPPENSSDAISNPEVALTNPIPGLITIIVPSSETDSESELDGVTKSEGQVVDSVFSLGFDKIANQLVAV